MIIRSYVLNNYVIIPKSILKSISKGSIKQFISITYNDKTSHDYLFYLKKLNNKFTFSGINGNLILFTIPHYNKNLKIIKGIYKQHDNNIVYKFSDIGTRIYSSEIELFFK